VPARFLAAQADYAIPAAVVFLGRRRPARDQALIDAVATVVRAKRAARVCVVSSFRVHFDDRRAARAEADALARLKPSGADVAVIRPGRVLSQTARTGAVLRTFAFLAPLVPRRLTSCFLDGDELFAALDRELSGPRSRFVRTHTLLGPNRPWHDL